MHILRKAAVVLAASGLAAFGAMAAGPGVANAATNLSLTSCNLGDSILTANVKPACTAATGTVLNPTNISIVANTSLLNELAAIPGIDQILALLGTSLGETIDYGLSCTVDGAQVTTSGSYDATGGDTDTKTINLATAVGSPNPSQCTVTKLDASSLVAVNTALLTGLSNLGDLSNGILSFGVQATANTAVPGTIWQQAATTASGLGADICLDDTGNGNNNAIVQVYQCNSDLAQYWVYDANNTITHNGDCLNETGGFVFLNQCNGSASEQWNIHGTNGHPGTIVDVGDGKCLTAPSIQDHTQFTVAACDGASEQNWIAPSQSAA